MRTRIDAPNIARDRQGAAALEFALVGPPLALLAFGILQYGVYFGVAHSVQQLTNDAARVAVAGLNEAERTQLVREHVDAHWRDYGLVREDSVAVSVSDAGGAITVQSRYDASYLPIFAMKGLVPMPPSTIEDRASVRVGGF
ncbi:MAG: TadE/TadG family type IV pilus assembly protein [Hyphomonadaceae bacterium]|nr:TadE/TadG family type IV pilus assembly protein [Hyphomonadaceae bacterium]